ncbi:helix-turn-helix domain-containing protein [Zunongwangia sp. HRR-M8]|uniref:helix-turn-helix domain-containing protein n=1 Tax=Zunongwangia sp. HRR-M8 TaxID=3015170 RepID=UPI0022DDEBC6|nr:helix-turn-helix domain-containing protein [Zunongwangia sp. HRR-M8]WBL20745.1 helix-turn-helix domain-containing protein [Zunongwangia sp. HRR-M8]
MSLLASYIAYFVFHISLGNFTFNSISFILFILLACFLIMLCNRGLIFKEIDSESEQSYIDYKTATEYSKLLDKIMCKEKFFLIHNLKIKQISRHLMLTPGELDYILLKAKRKTFTEYLDDFRIMELKEMLNIPEYQECDLKCLSEACGFDDYSDFEKALSRTYHIKPENFRRELLEEY